jgi:hypothetical protein
MFVYDTELLSGLKVAVVVSASGICGDGEGDA